MKYKNSIRIKAFILLLVFSLNMVVGFACAMGVDMGFNTAHHHEEDTIEVDVHPNGKIHQHEADEHHHHKKDASKKDDCCNDKVIKLQNLDKCLNQNAKTTVHTPVFLTLINRFLEIDIYNLSKAYPPIYKARFFYPPPPDIRILIQSFQI